MGHRPLAELTVELYSPVGTDPTPAYQVLDSIRKRLAIAAVSLDRALVEEQGDVGGDRHGEWFEIDLVQPLFYEDA